MLKKVITLFVVCGTMILGACQEDTTMEELIEGTELNDNDDGEDNDQTDSFPY